MIREIMENEFEPFYELLGEIECGSDFDITNPEHIEWVKEIAHRRYGGGTKFYALYENNKPVAIAGLEIEKMLYCKWKRSELMDIGVFKEHRRKGYGSKLLKFIEDEARSAGCWGLHLLTYAADCAAVSFYMSNGFAVVGTVADTNGPDDDGDVWLRKVLVED